MNESPRPDSAPRSSSHSLRVFLVIVVTIALGALLPSAAEARPSVARVSGVSLAADRLPGHLVVKWRAVRASAYHVRWSTARAALAQSRVVVARNHRRTDLGVVTASTHYVQVRAVQRNGRRGPWSVPTRVRTPKPVVVVPAPTPTPTPTPTPAPVVAPQFSVSVVPGVGSATLNWTFKPGSNGEVPTGVVVGRDGVDAVSGSGAWSTTDPIGTPSGGVYSGSRVFDNLVKGSAYALTATAQGLGSTLTKSVSVTPLGTVAVTPPPAPAPTPTPTPTPAPVVAPQFSVSVVPGVGSATLNWTFKPGSNGEVPTGVVVGRDGVDAVSGSGAWSTTDPIGTPSGGVYSGSRVFDNLVKGSAYALTATAQGLGSTLTKSVSVTPLGTVAVTPPPAPAPTPTPTPTPAPAPTNGLSFVDEFNDGSLDLTKWVREDFGYGYGSLEKFEGDADLTTQSNGQLRVSAIKDQVGPRPWRAGYLSTRGKFTMRTGTVEVRAKLPTEQGAWPAIWLHNRIGASGEPGSALAEIDIMELFPGGGVQGAGAYFTVHDWKNGNKGTELKPHVGTMDGGWHTWKVSWDARQMQLWIDGVSQGIITPESFAAASKGGDYRVFVDTPQYLIFDMAVGTSWGGLEPLLQTKRMDMDVDWIRVTKTS